MPQDIKLFRIFIGSPGGLDAERKLFADCISHYNQHHGEPGGILFKAVGWEDTLPGSGRPQELINEDLRRCDYAIFLFHDRWGTPTGAAGMVGTEEEWGIAEEMRAKLALRHTVVFFKDVSKRQLNDPGEQLKFVMEFREKIRKSGQHLHKKFLKPKEFGKVFAGLLAEWGRVQRSGDSGFGLSSGSAVKQSKSEPAPTFGFWINEFHRLAIEGTAAFDPRNALFCAEHALRINNGDTEWAAAQTRKGYAQLHIGDTRGAIESWEQILERLAGSGDIIHREEIAKALRNKSYALMTIGRYDDALIVYDDLASRFGAVSELALREHYAEALGNKGVMLGTMGRYEEAISVFDDLLSRARTFPEPEQHRLMADALYNKGVTLGSMGRSEDAIALYDNIASNLAANTELTLRKLAARALVNKGYVLGTLGQHKEAIAAYNECLSRFAISAEPDFRESVARALRNKGNRLVAIGQYEEAFAAYDNLLLRFASVTELSLQQEVAKALFNKGAGLRNLKRNADATAVFADLVTRFAAADEPEIVGLVEQARRLLPKPKKR